MRKWYSVVARGDGYYKCPTGKELQNRRIAELHDLLQDNIVQSRQCLGSTILLQNCKTIYSLLTISFSTPTCPRYETPSTVNR
jgi:hypothetical protein